MGVDWTGYGMSEEQKEEEIEFDQSHPELADAAPAEPRKMGKFAGALNPVILLMFMIMALLMVLIITLIGRGKGISGSSEKSAAQTSKENLEARRSELNRQRIAMGLPLLEDGSESVDDIAKRLRKDAETLAEICKKSQQQLADKDLEISASNAETLRLFKLRQIASQENARLQSELERARIDSSEYGRLQSELQRAMINSAEKDKLKMQLIESQAQSQAQKDAISQELAIARQKLAGQASAVNRDEYADLQRRFDEALRAKEFYELRTKELEASLSKANLFAKSENELLPAAVELFRRLRKMEGMKSSDFTTEYSKFEVELGANVLHTLDFETGSSVLNDEDKRRIEAITSEVPDGDLTLIIGYASETGNSESNQTLSSDRATSAAEYFSSKKRPGQLVQAVYLGQTDRFSSRVHERNQICEVWRIRKK
jgi:outer membrane protein OmpA-like peptidoglycan-associated protein